MSSTIARIILRRVSASSSSRELAAEIFVTPATMCATSAPKYSATVSIVVSVSSTTSWRRPTTIAASSASRSARTWRPPSDG